MGGMPGQARERLPFFVGAGLSARGNNRMRQSNIIGLGFVVLFLGMATSGCAASSEAAMERQIIGQQIHEIDSLRASQRQLGAELALLRDSLQFIDDIRTGQYYRDMRALEDRIRHLEFVLHQQSRGITVAELPADALFSPASADLTDRGRALLDSVVATIDRRAYSGHQVRVEGHADTAPLGPSLVEKYGSNWGLSTARAASVVIYLLNQHEFDPERLAAIGFGSARPIAGNDTPSGRRQNRRVRIAAIPTGNAVDSVSASTAEP